MHNNLTVKISILECFFVLETSIGIDIYLFLEMLYNFFFSKLYYGCAIFFLKHLSNLFVFVCVEMCRNLLKVVEMLQCSLGMKSVQMEHVLFGVKILFYRKEFKFLKGCFD